MTMRKPIYVVALTSILTASLYGCADFRPGATQATADAHITADVEAQLNKMADLGPPGSIEVQTLDHVVYLNGLVDVGLEKRNAVSIAMQVPGVTNVVDGIAVSHN